MPQANGSPARSRRPAGRTRSITEPIRQQLASLEEGSGELLQALREQLERRPYATLGAGVAAGFVLGGGLTLRLTTSLLALAGRVALANVASSAFRGLQPSSSERNDA